MGAARRSALRQSQCPFAANQHQVSPRAKLSFFPDPANTFWIYYGRLFLPTNVEDLRAITSTSQAASSPRRHSERDHFVELGYVHRFPFGVVSKISAYRKKSTPGIDDATVAGTAIVTSVNIDRVSITGLEGVLEIRPSGPFSGLSESGHQSRIREPSDHRRFLPA